MPSIVAEIGSVVEDHLKRIGMIVDPEMDAHQRQLIADKRAQFEAKSKKSEAAASKNKAASASDAAATAEPAAEAAGSFPPSATLCFKCNNKAMVLMDGCQTCLNCGYSKCG
jgi:hypothetical protein